MSQRLQDLFENRNSARDSEDAPLLVPIFSFGLIEQLLKHGVVQLLDFHHEPLHLLAYVDWEVAFWDLSGATHLHLLRVGLVCFGGSPWRGGIRAKKEVARGRAVGESTQASD